MNTESRYVRPSAGTTAFNAIVSTATAVNPGCCSRGRIAARRLTIPASYCWWQAAESAIEIVR